MKMPEVSCYYAPSKQNAIRIEAGSVIVWYSYQTPVAFLIPGYGMVVHQNQWGPTTGKHLNKIDPDKSKRVTIKEFQALWDERTQGL